MANKVYLYQDIYLYPGTFDQYTNLSKLYGKSGIYFEAKGEYSSDIGGYEYITKGPYNYTDTMYVPSSYTEMDTTYWVDMELDPSMDFSSCTLSGYDKNGNYMAYYFYEGTKVSIYCLEEDPSEEPPDLEQLSLVGSYYLPYGEPYLYGPTHNDMEEGATYYITFTAEGGAANSLYLKPFIYHEMGGEDYYPGVYPIYFDFSDGYISCATGAGGEVKLYKLKTKTFSLKVTFSNFGRAHYSILTSPDTAVPSWVYWYLYDQNNQEIATADNPYENSDYDFYKYLKEGNRYRVACQLSYSFYDSGEDGITDFVYSDWINFAPPISVSATLTKEGTSYYARGSYILNYDSIYADSPYLELYKEGIGVIAVGAIDENLWDVSEFMLSSGIYYVRYQVPWFGSINDNYYSETMLAVSDPIKIGNSFNLIMTRIADQVRLKAQDAGEAVSDLLSIVDMITTLNGLNTYGTPNLDIYDDTNFDSCMTKLSKVIRSQNGTFNSISSLKMIEMPAAIALIELYGEDCGEGCGESGDDDNPLTLSVTTRDNSIEINSNAYMFSEPSGTITWYGENYGELYTENISGFDGGVYTVDSSYIPSNHSDSVYAVVRVYASGYSKTAISSSFWVSGTGCSGDEQCAQCSEGGCCESNNECGGCQGGSCESCEGSCEATCEDSCEACEFGCQD